MANVTIGDLTNTPTLADDDKIEVEKGDGSPCHITGEDLRASLGASSLVSIQRVTTTSSQASVTFSSIPGTYDDLLLHITGRVSTASVDNSQVLLQLNGDTGSNYGYSRTGGFGTSMHGTTATGQTSAEIGYIAAATSQSGFPGFLKLLIPRYAGTAWKKVGLSHALSVGSGAPITSMNSFYWNNTAAVSSLLVKPTSTNYFIDGTIVELIGVQW